MRGQDIDGGSVGERKSERRTRENDREVCRKLQKRGETVIKSESLWSTFKRAVDFREKWQIVPGKYAQGAGKTTTHQAFTFSSFSHVSNHDDPTKIFKFIYSSCPRVSLQRTASKTNSLSNQPGPRN